MPDTLPDSIDALIRRERQPLPSHELNGCSYRRWAAAVCQAEVDHANADTWRAIHRHRYAITVDRFADPDAAAAYRLPHEMHAGAALNWLSHLQAHDSDRRGPWERWSRWDIGHRVWWLMRRRVLVQGWLRAMRAYEAARAPIVPGAAPFHPAENDPRDPDPSREGIFCEHNCWKCSDGSKPCVVGNPRQCEFPHARND